MKQKIYYLNDEEKARLIQRLTETLQGRNEIVFAYLYGSFVEGLPFRDIDVGVYISKVKEEESTLYSFDLAQILSKNLQMPIDVRVLNFASVSFLYHVIRGKLILERDEKTRLPLVERTIGRYLDMKPILRKGIKEAFGK